MFIIDEINMTAGQNSTKYFFKIRIYTYSRNNTNEEVCIIQIAIHYKIQFP